MRIIRNAGITISSVVLGVCWMMAPLPSSGQPGEPIFAQRLVSETLAKHPEITAVELATEVNGTCKTVASTDTRELGEKCDKDELEPLRTGKAYVEQEKDGFDVTVPMHDAAGKRIAAVSMDFKPAPGQTREVVLTKAQHIVAEMESQVAAKTKLFERN